MTKPKPAKRPAGPRRVAWPVDGAGLGAIGRRIFGDTWKSPTARALGIGWKPVKRYFDGAPIPAPIQLAVIALAEKPWLARYLARGFPVEGEFNLSADYDGTPNRTFIAKKPGTGPASIPAPAPATWATPARDQLGAKGKTKTPRPSRPGSRQAPNRTKTPTRKGRG